MHPADLYLYFHNQGRQRRAARTFTLGPGPTPTAHDLTETASRAAAEGVPCDEWRRYAERQIAAARPWKGRDVTVAILAHLSQDGSICAGAELTTKHPPTVLSSAELHAVFDLLPDWARGSWIDTVRRVEGRIVDAILRPTVVEPADDRA